MQDGRKRSKLLLPVALLVVATIIAVTGAFEVWGPNPLASLSSPPAGASTQVRDAWDSHIGLLEAMNVTQMVAGYAPNATLSVVSMGQGSYYGASSHHVIYYNATAPKQIGIFFQGTFFSDFILPKVYDANTTVRVDAAAAYVTSSFILSGTNVDGSNLIASVSCHATYVRVGQHWLISQETWILNSVNSH